MNRWIMPSSLSFMEKYLALALLLGGVTMPALAQNNLVLFGDRENVLAYRVRSTRPNAALNFFAFHLPLPRNRATAEIQISYPPEMAGVFAPDRLEVRDRRTGREIAITERIVNEELGSIRLVLQDPIPAQSISEVEIISQGATNPNRGMYRVRASVMGTEKNPIFLSVGKWMVSIF